MRSGFHEALATSFDNPYGFLRNRNDVQQKLELPQIKEVPDQCLFCKMRDQWPGGDVMNQGLWRKYNRDLSDTTTFRWPPEEKHYKGARLGEYSKPLIINENLLGFMNKAPVPLSESEDEMTLMAQASAASRRAMQAAVYSAAASDKAKQFYLLALMKAKALFRDPPVYVRPTADIFPLYSASTQAIEFLSSVGSLPVLPPRTEAEFGAARLAPCGKDTCDAMPNAGTITILSGHSLASVHGGRRRHVQLKVAPFFDTCRRGDSDNL